MNCNLRIIKPFVICVVAKKKRERERERERERKREREIKDSMVYLTAYRIRKKKTATAVL